MKISIYINQINSNLVKKNLKLLLIDDKNMRIRGLLMCVIYVIELC